MLKGQRLWRWSTTPPRGSDFYTFSTWPVISWKSHRNQDLATVCTWRWWIITETMHVLFSFVLSSKGEARLGWSSTSPLLSRRLFILPLYRACSLGTSSLLSTGTVLQNPAQDSKGCLIDQQVSTVVHFRISTSGGTSPELQRSCIQSMDCSHGLTSQYCEFKGGASSLKLSEPWTHDSHTPWC